jgi:Fe-S-cluster containining protein
MWRRKMRFDYPMSLRFECLKCGICCGDTHEKTRHVLMLKTEAEQITVVTKLPISEFAVKVEGTKPYVYEMVKTAEDGKCVFLKQNQCTIYRLRPLVCRFYPFELKSATTRKQTFTPTNECSGVGKGEVLSEEYFRSLFRLAKGRVKRSAD